MQELPSLEFRVNENFYAFGFRLATRASCTEVKPIFPGKPRPRLPIKNTSFRIQTGADGKWGEIQYAAGEMNLHSLQFPGINRYIAIFIRIASLGISIPDKAFYNVNRPGERR